MKKFLSPRNYHTIIDTYERLSLSDLRVDPVNRNQQPRPF